MRTALTLDDDVAAKLRAEAQRTGRSFRDIVNDNLRAGLLRRTAAEAREPFRVKPVEMGLLRPGLSLDDIWGLIDAVDGPGHR